MDQGLGDRCRSPVVWPYGPLNSVRSEIKSMLPLRADTPIGRVGARLTEEASGTPSRPPGTFHTEAIAGSWFTVRRPSAGRTNSTGKSVHRQTIVAASRTKCHGNKVERMGSSKPRRLAYEGGGTIRGRSVITGDSTGVCQMNNQDARKVHRSWRWHKTVVAASDIFVTIFAAAPISTPAIVADATTATEGHSVRRSGGISLRPGPKRDQLQRPPAAIVSRGGAVGAGCGGASIFRDVPVCHVPCGEACTGRGDRTVGDAGGKEQIVSARRGQVPLFIRVEAPAAAAVASTGATALMPAYS